MAIRGERQIQPIEPAKTAPLTLQFALSLKFLSSGDPFGRPETCLLFNLYFLAGCDCFCEPNEKDTIAHLQCDANRELWDA